MFKVSVPHDYFSGISQERLREIAKWSDFHVDVQGRMLPDTPDIQYRTYCTVCHAFKICLLEELLQGTEIQGFCQQHRHVSDLLVQDTEGKGRKFKNVY